MLSLNKNQWGIRFTYECSRSSVNFLVLVIFKDQGQLLTKTFFKSTDRNRYIPTDSCHHPNWLKAIPKGQFQRIRRNCFHLEDFQSQANILKIGLWRKSMTLEAWIKNYKTFHS